MHPRIKLPAARDILIHLNPYLICAFSDSRRIVEDHRRLAYREAAALVHSLRGERAMRAHSIPSTLIPVRVLFAMRRRTAGEIWFARAALSHEQGETLPPQEPHDS